jgi:hypothetical protein
MPAFMQKCIKVNNKKEEYGNVKGNLNLSNQGIQHYFEIPFFEYPPAGMGMARGEPPPSGGAGAGSFPLDEQEEGQCHNRHSGDEADENHPRLRFF